MSQEQIVESHTYTSVTYKNKQTDREKIKSLLNTTNRNTVQT